MIPFARRCALAGSVALAALCVGCGSGDDNASPVTVEGGHEGGSAEAGEAGGSTEGGGTEGGGATEAGGQTEGGADATDGGGEAAVDASAG